MALSFFNLGAWGALYAVTPEAYPTVSAGPGRRCGRGLRPARVDRGAALRAATAGRRRLRTRFGVFAAFFVVGAVATWGLPELRGRALEDDDAAPVMVRTSPLGAQ